MLWTETGVIFCWPSWVLLLNMVYCFFYSESEGKHIAPVWHVKWVVRDQNNGDDKDEILVSVAADGRVTNWSIRKGFECAGKSIAYSLYSVYCTIAS